MVVQQNSDFVLKVKAEGSILPENILVFIGDESYFMENKGSGIFQYKINSPSETAVFHLEANTVISPDYELNVVSVPTISSFEMKLTFPNYLKRKTEIIKGTGNAVIPEGTLVEWKIIGSSTESIVFNSNKISSKFVANDNSFVFAKKINQNTEYKVITYYNNIKNI